MVMLLRCCVIYIFLFGSLAFSWKTAVKRTKSWLHLSSALVGLQLVIGVSGAFANEGSFIHYVDTVGKYALDVPEQWDKSEGNLSGDRTVTAFVNPARPTTSASVVSTPIPADFTRLTSFGDLRSYLIPKGDGIETSVIKESTKGEQIELEYITKKVDENIERHVITVFALRPAESVVGLTCQALEGSDWIADKALLETATRSFKIQQ
jgi:hypothetical protein